MNFLINHLPFVVLIIIIIVVELLHHRNVSEKSIVNYKKELKHKKNNPNYYTKNRIVSDMKRIRSMTYGMILIYLALTIFFSVIIIGDTKLESHQQNIIYILINLIILIVYSVGKIANNIKKSIIIYSIIFVVIIALWTSAFFLFGLLDSKVEIKTPIKTIITTKTDTLITTKSGSKWTQTKTNNETYYHIVREGESLEYIFNDIHLSLQKAKEQGFDILKETNNGKRTIIPVSKYQDELKIGTFLYSGLHPGDTVYLSKSELNKFRTKKNQ